MLIANDTKFGGTVNNKETNLLLHSNVCPR